MPPPRSITLLSPDELRVELVALLSDALLHHATRGRHHWTIVARDHRAKFAPETQAIRA